MISILDARIGTIAFVLCAVSACGPSKGGTDEGESKAVLTIDPPTVELLIENGAAGRQDYTATLTFPDGHSRDVTDETVVRPHNSYAMSKYTEEQIALNLGRRYAIPSVAMRYSIVQGPRQSFRNAYSGALRIFAMQVLAGEWPVVYEDGRQLRDFVYVGDVARANQLVLEDARPDYQAFNVGAGRAWTVLEFARIMAAAAGRPELEPHLPGEYRFGDTRHIVPLPPPPSPDSYHR